MRTAHLKNVIAIGVAVLSAGVASSVAFASVNPDVRGVWRMVAQTDPDFGNEGPYRLRAGTRDVDSADPWTGVRAANGATAGAPAEQRFHRSRSIDERDPWTGERMERVTPSLTRAPSLEKF